MPNALGTRALAERWACSDQHIRNLIRRGDLPAFQAGRILRVPMTAIEAFESCGSSNTEESGPSEPKTVAATPPASRPRQHIVTLPNGRRAMSFAR